ncbi:MIF-like protein mif-2 [Bombyx mandarina]|uniref:L-dopachrome isomerase n=1 Tax=Bombyx mandarina TaxID=7092 RepID=A0A6J2K099_BOMMA|nr:MIF-like protein mif-2 [Bombyx mandarina]
MPCLKIFTNLTNSFIPNDFVNKIIPVLSKAVQKSPEKFICLISPDCALSIGGESSTPGAVATLESIGNLGPSQNKVIAKEITDFVEKELGISKDRFFLTFYDLKNFNVAKGGITVDVLEP